VKNRIEAHVNEVFAGMSSERYVLDVKEELLSNLNDKYDDLIAGGKTEEEAYSLVISSIGDIQDLFSDGAHYGYSAAADIERKRNTKSVFVSMGIAIYIISLAALYILSSLKWGVGAMIVLCAIGTGLTVYGINMGKTVYKKADNTFVENYKENAFEKDRIAKMKGAISSSLWTLIVVAYLAISFITDKWSITWIIFLAGAFIQQFALFYLAKPAARKGLRHSMFWIAVVIIYFLISFGFDAWSWSWMLFLTAVAVQQITRLIDIWKSTD